MNHKEQYERMQKVAETYFVNLARMAELIGRSKTVLYSYKNNNVKYGRGLLYELKDKLNINPEYIEFGAGPMLLGDPPDTTTGVLYAKYGEWRVVRDYWYQRKKNIDYYVPQNEYVMVPMLFGSVPCGFPDELFGETIMIPVEKWLVENYHKPHILVCRGDSMSPIIEDGWLVIAETIDNVNQELHNSDIIVARLNNEFLLKYYVKQGDSIILVPENMSKFVPILLAEHDDFKAIGVVKTILEAVNKSNRN
jgi:SOS-response transcriptional repressor LexA